MSKDNNKCCKMTSIGGQALIEGIMMRGPKKSAMAVRNSEGEIVLETFETSVPKRAKFFKLPFIRGIFNFIDSMKVGYKCLMRSAEISGLEEIKEEVNEKNAKKGKKAKSGDFLTNVVMILSVILGVLLAVGLFIFLPTFITDLIIPEGYPIWKGVLQGCFRLVIFIAYMLLMLLMKDIRRTFMYHGAEHKTIFCYEQGLELTVENVRKQKRFHPRCGTSFMILMILVGVVLGICIEFTGIDHTILKVAIKILMLPLVMGVGYELIKLAGRKNNFLTRLISLPGVWMQHITTIEPDDSMIECAIEAMKAVIPDDESDKW